MNEKRLKVLSETPGVSGREGSVADYLTKELNGLGFSCHTDSFGNLHAHRPGEGKHILLEAHMDQVGMMVSEITDDGFVYFSLIGGIDLRILPSQKVTIWGRQPVDGVVVCLPSADTSKNAESLNLKRFCIDTGLKNSCQSFVSVGDYITFHAEGFCQNGCYFGPALDNRVSVEAILSFLEQTDLTCALSILFAVQEEVGMLGATVGTGSCSADLCVVLDVTFGKVHNGKSETFLCGKGPTIGIGPSVSRKEAMCMMAVADRLHLPYQIEAMGGSSGTDAWVIQLSGLGVPTALLSIPLRYMHTSTECFSVSDFENAVLLLEGYLKEVCQG